MLKGARRYVCVCLTLLLALMVPAIVGCSNAGSEKRADVIEFPDEAEKLLKEGNERFVKGTPAAKDLSDTRRKELAKAQKPFAVIVSCSDSRVPPEHIFDQALGDIFVVRVAGNVVDDVAIGSVEYAVEHLKAPLVVVLGHEKCGAVKATVDGGTAPGSIGSIVRKIQSSVDAAKEEGASGDKLVETAVEENAKETMAILEQSSVLEEKLKNSELKIIGAKYKLESGEVEWF